LKLIATT